MGTTKDEQWTKMYNLAKQYYKENNHLIILQDYKINEINLGKWISHQREYYYKEKLSEEKIKLLEDINMIWDIKEYQWQENYKLAKEYYAQHRHLLIPRDYEINGIKLGSWIGNQRQYYKKGTNALFTQERMDLLDKIGMVWNVYKTQWEENYQLAKNYYEKNNHLLIPNRYIINDVKLGVWIQKQRQDYKNDKLSQKKINLLESIDMIWDASSITGCSFPEYLIYTYFKSIYGENKVLYRDNSLGFELDIYIPHLKIAIEYDGIYHLNKQEEDENKNLKCFENNIILYRFRENKLPQLKITNNLNLIYLENFSNYEYLTTLLNEKFKIITKKTININLQDVYNDYSNFILNIFENKWQEKYNLAKEFYNKHGHLLIPIDYEINDVKLGIWISNQRSIYQKFVGNESYKKRRGFISQEKIDLLKSINMIWNPFEFLWEESYNLAKEYYKENGHLIIPQKYEINNINLGSWIYKQRKDYKNNKLSKEQIALLESIGMVWIIDKDNPILKQRRSESTLKNSQWQEKYELAKQYYNKNGHLIIPQKYEINNINLGSWIYKQRKDYNEDKLSKERIDLLNTIDMVWTLDKDNPILKQRRSESTLKNSQWQEKYELAKQYYNENGHLLIPQRYKINNINLGQWIQIQREYYKETKLSKEKIDLLNSIGMIWEPLETQWQEKYNLAKEFYKENGHLLIPQNYEINNIKLGQWFNNLRQDYKNKKLSQEKIDELNNIGMIWNSLEYQWEENYQLAKKYYKNNGNLLIPFRYEINNINLGHWIYRQRKDYKNKTNPLFTQEKIELLNKIGMVWEPFEVQWMEKYQLAKKYYEDNKNLLISQNYTINEIKLGFWINDQRKYYKKNKLSQEQIELLESIGMVWSIK